MKNIIATTFLIFSSFLCEAQEINNDENEALFAIFNSKNLEELRKVCGVQPPNYSTEYIAIREIICFLQAYSWEDQLEGKALGILGKSKEDRWKAARDGFAESFAKSMIPGKTSSKLILLDTFGVSPHYLAYNLYNTDNSEMNSFSELNSLQKIEIPKISNVSPMSLKADNDDIFNRMRISLAKIVEASVNANTGISAGVLQASALASMSKDSNLKVNLSLLEGEFNNLYSSIFKRIINKDMLISDATLAFDLWDKYARNQINNSYKYIENLTGLIVYYEYKDKINRASELQANVNGNLTTPLINVGLESNLKFGSSTEYSSSGAHSKIFLTAKPKYVPIPSPAELFHSYNRIANSDKNLYVKDATGYSVVPNNEINLLPNETTEFYIKFGPLSNKSDINGLKIDSSFSKSQFAINGSNFIGELEIDNSLNPELEGGFSYLRLKMKRNENYFLTLPNATPEIVKSGKIKIYYDEGVDIDNDSIKDFLAGNFPIIIKTSTKPFLKFIDNNNIFEGSISNDEILFNIQGNFDTPHNVTEIKIINFTAFDQADSVFNLNFNGKIATTNNFNREFELNLRLNKNKFLRRLNNRMQFNLNCIVTIDGIQYQRTLSNVIFKINFEENMLDLPNRIRISTSKASLILTDSIIVTNKYNKVDSLNRINNSLGIKYIYLDTAQHSYADSTSFYSYSNGGVLSSKDIIELGLINQFFFKDESDPSYVYVPKIYVDKPRYVQLLNTN